MADNSNNAILDPQRLAALRRVALLDTPAEAAFDRLTQLVVRTLRVPVSLVSLVEEDRQFFKSCAGLPEPWASRRETPLSHSLCQHVVISGEPLIVNDAREHDIAREQPAIAYIGVMAYAGIPLVTHDGYVLGTLCAIDSAPRDWTTEEIGILRDLAQSVLTEIELREEIIRRAQIQTQLRAREAQLVEAQRIAKIGSWEWEISSGEVSWSDEMFRIFGVSRDSFSPSYDSFMMGVHPDDRTTIHSEVQRSIMTAGPYKVEHRVLQPAGIVRFVCSGGEVIADRDGNPQRLVGVTQDVTEARRAEIATHRQLKEEATREQKVAGAKEIADILESVNDAFVSLDRNWCYSYVNRRAAELFGRKPEDLIGRNIWSEFPEGIGQPFHKAYERAVQTRLPQEIEEYYEPWNRWFENRIYPTANGLAIFFHEITERKLAERALRGSEARFRALFTSSPLAIIALSADDVVELWNPAAELMFGWRADEIIGQKIPVVPDVTRDEFNRLRQNALGGQTMTAIETVRQRRDGRLLDVLLSVAPFAAASGQVGVLKIVADVTEHRQLERRLLQASDEERRRIGRDLHDDLGQQLTGIAMLAATLHAQLEKQQNALAHEAEQIAQLISGGIGDLRRVVVGLSPFDTTATSFGTALSDLANKVARASGIQCDADVDLQLNIEQPRATELYRIAQEALTNAVKHSGASKIQLTWRGTLNRAELIVEDNGRGYAEDAQSDHGIGFKTMALRARMVGAHLIIVPSTAGGLKVRCVSYFSGTRV